MRASPILLVAFAGAIWAASAGAQTTAGTSATIVVPVVAQTGSFTSEVTVYNPTDVAMNVGVSFYDAQNTLTPGLKACTSLALAGGRSVQFSVATQCALPAPPNFGLLIMATCARRRRREWDSPPKGFRSRTSTTSCSTRRD